MWSAIQTFLGPVPAPVFVLMFAAGLLVAFLACAPTRWVERGARFVARWRAGRR
jgi:hypothetical protein